MHRILRLDKAGVPYAWISMEHAITLISKKQMLWSLGARSTRVFGGINQLGVRSSLDIPSIIACDGVLRERRFVPPLCNALLFRRDDYTCMYCGQRNSKGLLSRDHIFPTSCGGLDHWKNVITACKRCNQYKGNQSPEEAGMTLLAIPFEPNRFEFLFLANRAVLADQMDYLRSGFKCLKAA